VNLERPPFGGGFCFACSSAFTYNDSNQSANITTVRQIPPLSSLKSITRSYYAAQGFHGLSLGVILPAYVLFFWSRGLNLFEIAVLASVFEASILLLEIPTGLFADIFGRRRSVVSSYLLQSLAGFIFLLSPSFWFFAIAEMIQGLGETLKTGALEAWMVDGLKANGGEEKQSRTFANGERFSRLGLLLGILLGGFWGHHFLDLVFLPFGVFHLACSVILLRYMPVDHGGILEASPPTPSRLKETLTGGLRSIAATRIVLLLVVLSLFIEFAGETVDQYYQIFLADLFSLDPRYFSLMLIFSSLFVILSVGRIMSKNPSERRLVSLFGAIEAVRIGAILLFALAGEVLLAVLAFTLVEIIKGWERPLLLDAINRNIRSAQRATAISFFSLVSSGGEVLAGPIIGSIALGFGLKPTFATGAAVLTLGLLLFLFFGVQIKGRGVDPSSPSGS
jgi:DHA3 family tetracycline resistance protein-like MFS transporter